MPKLSELDPSKIQVVDSGSSDKGSSPLRLSELDISKVELITPEQPAAPQGPSQGEALAIGVQQGATLGFGEEVVAGIDAFAETVREKLTGNTSLAPGEGIKVKYGKSLEQQRGKIKEAEQAFPMTTLGGKLIGGAPASLATGAGGLIRQAATSGALGGVQSLGEAEDISAESAKQAGKAGAFSAGLTGLLGGAIKLVKGVFKTPAGAFKLSEELKESVADPEVAKAVGRSIDSTGERFKEVVRLSKDSVGQELDTLASKIQVPVAADDAFNPVVKELNSFNPGRNEAAKSAKLDLLDTIESYGKQIQQDVASGTSPFLATHKAKQQLSKEIFEQGRFSNDKYVDKLAKKAYSNMSKMLTQADPTKDYGMLNKAYAGLSSTDADSFTVKALEYLENPYNAGVRKAFGRVTGDVTNLPKPIQDKYLSNLLQFLDKDFSNAAIKQQILTSVGNPAPLLVRGGGPVESITSSVMSSVPRAAAKAGELYGKTPSIAKQGIKAGARTLEGLGRAATIRTGSTLGEKF